MTIEKIVGASDGITDTFLTQTYPAIASAISSPIYYIAIIYWAVFGYKIYAGYEPVKWNSLLSKAMMTTGVLATLNWNGLAHTIYAIFTSFMESTASTIMAGKSTATMLDALCTNVGQIASILQGANFSQIGLIILGSSLFFINCILFIVAVYFMIISKLGLAITMVLLPVFIGFFFFEQTRQWTFNWISKMLNFSLIYIFVIAIVRFGFLAFSDAIDQAGKTAGITEVAMLNIKEIFAISAVEGILIVFMLQAKSWAAALSGGAAIQGASTIINSMLMVSSFKSRKEANK